MNISLKKVYARILRIRNGAKRTSIYRFTLAVPFKPKVLNLLSSKALIFECSHELEYENRGTLLRQATSRPIFRDQFVLICYANIKADFETHTQGNQLACLSLNFFAEKN